MGLAHDDRAHPGTGCGQHWRPQTDGLHLGPPPIDCPRLAEVRKIRFLFDFIVDKIEIDMQSS